ncbi:MAG: rhomboid family intramembrane serine protease [Pseudomonadota bacterium]
MQPGDELIEVFAAEQPRAVRDAALVLSAMAIEHSVERRAHLWCLVVPPHAQADAHEQLDLYWQENNTRPTPATTVDVVDSGWWGVLGYLCVIWAIPTWQSFTYTDLRAAGVLHAGAVMDGELWRAVTALTLHADIGHIFSNSLFGAIFGLFVGRYLGSGFGWLLVLCCGILANGLNAMISPDPFRALGASTATFAALGLVPAFGWRRGYFRGRGWVRGFAPIFGAIALLSFTGFGGENIDVFGHLFGFAFGLGAGLLFAHTDLAGKSQADQQRAAGLAIAIVVVAWLYAV